MHQINNPLFLCMFRPQFFERLFRAVVKEHRRVMDSLYRQDRVVSSDTDQASKTYPIFVDLAGSLCYNTEKHRKERADELGIA